MWKTSEIWLGLLSGAAYKRQFSVVLEVRVSVVPYAQNEGMYHVIHNRLGVFTRKIDFKQLLRKHISKLEVQMN